MATDSILVVFELSLLQGSVIRKIVERFDHAIQSRCQRHSDSERTTGLHPDVMGLIDHALERILAHSSAPLMFICPPT